MKRSIINLFQAGIAFLVYSILDAMYSLLSLGKVTLANTLILVIATALSFIFVFWLYKRQLDKRNEWGFNEKPHWDIKRIIQAIIVGAILIGADYLFLKVLGGTSQNQAALDSQIGQSNALLKIMLGICAPFLEELMFRGMFFNILFPKKITDIKLKIFAILLCGFVFAYLHDTALTKYIFIYWFMGCVVAWLYLETKDIRYPIIAHGINNIFELIF